jgi:hypothetical protein
VKGSGVCSTSFVRPLLRSSSMLIVCMATSGFVPASRQDGGSSDPWLNSGEREGLICNFLPFNKVISAYARDPCVFSYPLGSFV